MGFDPAVPETASNWRSYLCKVNGHISSVFVNLALSLVAPLAATPKLAWLWIRLIHPRDDGLSTDEEFDALCRFEDDVEAALAKSGSGVYAGRITTCGRREFYFYITPGADLRADMAPVLSAHPEYAYQLGERPDAAWDHYRTTLSPGPRGLEQILGVRTT
ncbi:MAG TPA: DUF695 domain-containing protein [Telluria sp.]